MLQQGRAGHFLQFMLQLKAGLQKLQIKDASPARIHLDLLVVRKTFGRALQGSWQQANQKSTQNKSIVGLELY